MEKLVITIARQYGSGGKKIGQELAKRLGIPFYGKDKLMEIAKGKEEITRKCVLSMRNSRSTACCMPLP